MPLLDVNESVVVVIDLQGKLMDMIHRPKLVVAATVQLLKLAELFKVPVLLTEQYSKGLGKTHPEVWAAYEALTVEKKYIDKTSMGCCGDPNFAKFLRELRPEAQPGRRQVVIAGIELHICVMQTVMELIKGRYEVHLCWDCVSGRGEEARRHAIGRMEQAGAIVTNHESVGFEWARDKNHPCFKSMSNLFKESQLLT